MSTLQKAVDVSQTGCKVSQPVGLSSTMPVSLLASRDSTMCDSGSESMGFSDTEIDIGSSVKEALLSLKVLNGDSNMSAASSEKSTKEQGSNGISCPNEDEKDKDADSLSQEKVTIGEDSAKEEEQSENVCQTEDQLLGAEMVESCASKAFLDEDEELRLLMDVDEEDKVKELDMEAEDVSQEATSKTKDEVDITCLPDKVTSPVSECDSSQSSFKQDVDKAQSDSESVSSNSKHPLLIGQTMKYSFKGIMKTAVSRMSQDSDSLKSSSPMPDQDLDSKPSSPKPDSSTCSQEEATDLPADSSTMPDDRNLFEKLSLITDTSKKDSMSESNSEISTSKPQSEDIEKEEEEEVDTIESVEPMETESTQLAADEDSSRISEVSTLSADNPEDSSSSTGKFSKNVEVTQTKEESETILESSGCGGVGTQLRQESESVTLASCQSPSSEELQNKKSDEKSDTLKIDSTDSRSVNSSTNEFSSDSKAKTKDPNLIQDTEMQTEKISDNQEKLVNVEISEAGNKEIIAKGDCQKHEVKEEGDKITYDQSMKSSLPSENQKSESDLTAVKTKEETDSVKSEMFIDLQKTSSKMDCEDTRTCVKTEEPLGSQSNESIDSTERPCSKRSANDDSEESQPKRSRLDFVIGKLGTQIGISPENIKCEETMFDSDESCKASSDSTENPSEEVTSEDDEASPSVRLSEERLEEMIKQKIKDVLEHQKKVLTEQFKAQIEELQASNEVWKTQAKDLQRRAVELMAHQQRQDRRRAARISGQRRNVGVQVGEERINSANQQSTSKPGSPGRVSLLNTPATVSNQVLVQKMAAVPNTTRVNNTPTVKSILNGNRMGQLSATASHPASPGTQAPLIMSKTRLSTGQVVSSTGQTPGVSTLVKVIDLTSDEEGSSKTGASSVTSIPPGTRIVFSPGTTAATTLLTNSAAATLNRPRQPGVQYQYLYTPSNSGIRQGSVLTVLTPSASSASQTSTPAPPQLTRPPQPTVTRPTQALTAPSRAPPPLQSAPTTTTTTAPKATPQQRTGSSGTTPTVINKNETKAAETAPEATKHPAPLPARPSDQNMDPKLKKLPPKPGLKISRVSQGIVLSWNMTTSNAHAEIASYQLFAYQETSSQHGTSLWKKVGDVKALPLPMACTLTQFQEGNKYHFAVRAVDIHGRVSIFSEPSTIHLVSQTNK